MTNVLCDRHHAGLYRSMQLLSRRLGWTLHTPVGHEWFDEGYWRFGAAHLGRQLADQYLTITDDWVPVARAEGHLMTEDPEFPGAPIWGVTLDAARRMGWSHVIATVQDDQHGFARFAGEVGAAYVLQVGNTGQDVDWHLDPLALVSSEVPILGRGVRYHQELDPIASAWREPSIHAPVIRSFVNCMPSIACAPLWREAQALMPDVAFAEHGIDGRDGVVKPIDAIADLMAGSLFGWHDKAHGDGFGHVLHGWAAIGRPVIGHASHYAGKMGSVLWRDMETCVDLDRHDLPEAAAIVREVAADPERHARMCRAIRAVYDAVVDHDAETDLIRGLLGMPVAVAA